ncbi:AI-2E family transporter [Pyrococcus horikoshii]|nr:AI-2E family transporter [Pyrococcus horikoshii]HII61941.1 AI-2E family transporter [Pyrococcus horikoshii]
MEVSRVVTWIIIITLVALAIKTILPFFSPLFFAFITAYALYPLHIKLKERIGSKNSAILLTLFLLLGALMILLILVYTLTPVIGQAYDYLTNLEKIKINIPLVPKSVISSLEGVIDEFIERGKGYLVSLTFSVPKYLLQVIVYLTFVYFFLVKEKEARELITFEDEKLIRIIERGNLTLQALIRVWLLLNIVKGILMTLGFLIFKVSNLPTAILAGLLTVLFSFIPLFEGWMIWLAGAFYLVKQGHIIAGIGLAVYGFTLVSPLPDFTIRPKLVAREAEFNDVLVLIGMIGGTWGLGLKGLIIGPIVLNVAIEMLREWKNVQAKTERS